jgi:sugar phosphate isomerase/epimerase
VAKRQFGVSTRLYDRVRLRREHLLEIAAHGFETVEIVAARAHVDYHNPAVVADLQQWLAEAGLELRGLHVPLGADVEQALFVARRIPLKVLVVESGAPREFARVAERLAGLAAPLGVAVAIDSAGWTPAGSLVHFVESGPLDPERSTARVGICLDFGQAQMQGDVAEIIEVVSEHLVATHVHDCVGRRDDHLIPFEGAIDWPGALTALQKVGYESAVILDIAARGSIKDALVRARRARERMESFLCMSI